jgi:hypothetical protein
VRPSDPALRRRIVDAPAAGIGYFAAIARHVPAESP